MTVFGYARVSTDDQRNSFDQQQMRIQEYFSYHSSQEKFAGQEFGGTFADEDVSGFIPMFDRDAGMQLFDRLSNGDHIVCTALDRCFRGVVDALLTQQSLMERDIYLHIISVGIDFSTPWGKLMYATLASYAEFERDMIRMRTREGLDRKRINGLPVNQNAPIGYRKEGLKRDSRFVPDWKERGLAIQIVEWRDVHQLGWAQIINKLLGSKRSGTGGEWSERNIKMAYQAAQDNFPLFDGQPDPFTMKARQDRHTHVMLEDSDD